MRNRANVKTAALRLLMVGVLFCAWNVGLGAQALPLGPLIFEPFALNSGSSISDITFADNGRTLYATMFTRPKHYTIVESHRVDGRWSPPTPASFSGKWRDLEEVVSPDSSYMIFSSNRPVVSGGGSLPSFYHKTYTPGGGGNLWIVRRAGIGWGTPVRLPDAVNANTSTFSPAVSSDGTLYFMRAIGPMGSFRLFVSHRVGGVYTHSQLAPFADANHGEFDPTVAPDDSFVIFSSTRPPIRKGTDHLFISYNRGGNWSRPIDMGQPVNAGGDDQETRLSPDAKALYYSSAAEPEHLTAARSTTAPLHVLFLPLSD